MTSIGTVGDTLSPYYLTYTEAFENLYLRPHTDCIMIHIFSASAYGQFGSSTFCLSRSLQTDITDTDRYVISAYELSHHACKRFAAQWWGTQLECSVTSSAKSPDGASPSNKNHVIRIMISCRILIITSVICNSLVSVWQLKHTPHE